MRTTLLFDFNNLAMRCAFLPQVRLTSPVPHMEFWAYLVFTSIYEFIIDIAADTMDVVDVVLACDSTTGYWRREIYPPYKMDRVDKRAADDVNWEYVYAQIDAFLANVSTYLPWAVVRVPKCEADDVIYVASENLNDGYAVVHSTDVDFVQLVSDKVRVFNPLHGFSTFPGTFKVGSAKKLCQTVEEFLDLSILTGQGGKDNVYNVVTPTDWAPSETSKRKPPFGVKGAAALWENNKVASFLQENSLLENFERNKQLIDLRMIPQEYKDIVSQELASKLGSLPNVSLRGFLSCYDWPSLSMDENNLQEMATLLSIASGKEIADETEMISQPVFDDTEAADSFNLSL